MTISHLHPSAERFLVDLARIHQASERAQRSISTGLRVSTPSDSPNQITGILQLQTDIERALQVRSNLVRLKSEVDTAERTVALAIQLLDRARVLASEGAGTIATPEHRKILAAEVEGLLEQLVASSRTTVEGRFIFSGDLDQNPSYELDLSGPTGVNRLITSRASRQIQHPSGTRFGAARTAEEIFDKRNADDSLAAENVFAAVNGLRVALESNDQPGVEAALLALRAAGDHLNIQLAFYGNVQRTVEQAIDASYKLELQLKTELSQQRDADLTTSILELQRGRTHEEAALAARAHLPRTSLFDYLG